jgi:hypothetical protein
MAYCNEINNKKGADNQQAVDKSSLKALGKTFMISQNETSGKRLE